VVFSLPFILIFKNQIKNQKVSLKNQKEIKKIKKSIAFYAIGDPPPPLKCHYWNEYSS
jgi:hypothetical protein